jgi:hypothetical protein
LPAKILAASAGTGLLEFSLRHSQSSVFGREESGHALSDDLFLPVAESLLRPPVPTENAPFEIDSEDRMIGYTLHHQAEELIIRLHWKFSLLSLRIVHRRRPPEICFD